MWRESASLSFCGNKIDVIHLWKLCKPCVFDLLKVEIWAYIAKTQSVQALDWSCTCWKLPMHMLETANTHAEIANAHAGNCQCVRKLSLRTLEPAHGRPKRVLVIEISFVTGKTTEPSRTSLNFVSQSLYKYIN